MQLQDSLGMMACVLFRTWSVSLLLVSICSLLPVACLAQTDEEFPSELEFEIMEESPPLSYVGNVATEAELGRRFDANVLQKIQFGFIPQPNQDRNMFDLETATGVIRTAVPIDRDSRCPQRAECFIHLDVAIVKPTELFQVIAVKVKIIDKNDKSPSFSPDYYTVKISESEPAGISVNLPIAIDLDSPRYGIKGYRIMNSVQQFELKQETNANGQTDVQLVLLEQLDREQVENYQVFIEAFDGGMPANKGTLTVDILVEDDNDHSPRFDNATFEVSVRENFPLDRPFFIAVARDPDSGDNGEIVYAFGPRTTALYGNLFHIDGETGEVSLSRPLDYEQETTYHLEVTASDLGPSSRSSLATLILHVQDVNDNVPQITISTLTLKRQAEIPENSVPGKFTAHVSVVDLDKGKNGEVSCTLLHPVFALVQMKTKNQYKILTALDLDRERIDHYAIKVECRDSGNPSLSATANLTVNVLDENDHTPLLSQASYFGVIPENNDHDEYILLVNASDGDLGKNAQLTYEIMEHESMSDYVYIQHGTGVIRATSSLDYETVKQLKFTVVVHDRAEHPKSSTASVTVNILDVNDEPPRVSHPFYSFSVDENQGVSTSVGKVTASDKDSESYNKFTFSLTAQRGHEHGVFAINAKSGEIFTQRILDREDQDMYTLDVIAVDSESPSLASTATVTIYVNDKNDNYPSIDYPTKDNSTVYISNRVPLGYDILKIVANDQDIGENAELQYQLMSGDVDGAFMVNKTTGILVTAMELKDIKYKVYDLLVMVRDAGSPVKADTRNIQVIVDRSVPFLPPGSKGLVHKNNLTIIIVVASVSGFIIVILIIAILALKTLDHRRRSLGKEYNCRQEEQKILNDLNVKAVEANGNLHAKERQQMTPNIHVDVLRERGTGDGRPAGQQGQGQKRKKKERQEPGSPQNADWNRGVIAMESGHNQSISSIDHGLPFADFEPDVPQVIGVHDKHLEAHLMALLKQDQDAESASSAEVSNADSGRGPSEEGEHRHNAHLSSDPLSPGNQPNVSPRGHLQPPRGRPGNTAGGNGYTNGNRGSASSNLGHLSHNIESGSYSPRKASSEHELRWNSNGNRQNPVGKECISPVRPERSFNVSRANSSAVPALSTFVGNKASPSSSHPPSQRPIIGDSAHSANGCQDNQTGDAWQNKRRKPELPLRDITEEEDNLKSDDEKVDPKDLCEQIDKLFFKTKSGVVV